MARKTIHHDLAGKLERRLSRMRQGNLLPSEQALADEFAVSKPTIRRTLDVFVKDGYIKKMNGIGSVISGNTQRLSRELVFLCGSMVFFAETIRYFCSRATEMNYLPSIVPLTGDGEIDKNIIFSVNERSVAGVLLYPNPDAPKIEFVDFKVPVVHLMRLYFGSEGNIISFENERAVSNLICELYDKHKCRRFAFYGPNMRKSTGVERFNGFCEGVKRCGLKLREELVCKNDETIENFWHIFTDEKKRPDAICCYNDNCAADFIETANERSVDLNSIKITGFDNSPFLKYIKHEVLTIAPPLKELGIMAANLLVRQIENSNFGFVKEKVPYQIIKI